WFTAIYPVALGSDQDEPVGESLKRVKEQLHRVPRRGVGYGVFRYLVEDPELRRSAALAGPDVAFNYLGQLNLPLGDSGFALASESCGLLVSPRYHRRYRLEIDSRVVGGRLTISWTYSRNLHRSERIQALAGDFVAQLGELLEHCRSCPNGIYTPSDFPALECSQEDLDLLVARLADFREGEHKRFLEDIYPLSPTQQ